MMWIHTSITTKMLIYFSKMPLYIFRVHLKCIIVNHILSHTDPHWMDDRGLKIILYITVTSCAIASQITSLTIVYSTVYSDADQRKHQSSASLAFVWGIHRGPVNSPHKWPVTRKMFPFDDVIMIILFLSCVLSNHFLMTQVVNWKHAQTIKQLSREKIITPLTPFSVIKFNQYGFR